MDADVGSGSSLLTIRVVFLEFVLSKLLVQQNSMGPGDPTAGL